MERIEWVKTTTTDKYDVEKWVGHCSRDDKMKCVLVGAEGHAHSVRIINWTEIWLIITHYVVLQLTHWIFSCSLSSVRFFFFSTFRWNRLTRIHTHTIVMPYLGNSNRVEWSADARTAVAVTYNNEDAKALNMNDFNSIGDVICIVKQFRFFFIVGSHTRDSDSQVSPELDGGHISRPAFCRNDTKIKHDEWRNAAAAPRFSRAGRKKWGKEGERERQRGQKYHKN